MTRSIKVAPGRELVATPVFDTYWRFAHARQQVFMNRVAKKPPPWTLDPVLAAHRFTNVYRGSDRVSQYLIRNVIYRGSQEPEEIFFRTLLFKLFNRISTWEKLTKELGVLAWRDFDFRRYAGVLDRAMARDERIYSAAYIMPSPHLGELRKHRNHLRLLQQMMKSDAPKRVVDAAGLAEVFRLLRDYPSLGDFLAFQFTIDLNYSSAINFSEMDFVVAGPGAKDGIRKCFADTAGLDDADVIRIVVEIAENEFNRLGLPFRNLWGRPLQLIDCQNVFCEVDKYARVMHPEAIGESGRTRIKQRYTPRVLQSAPQWYPPKWKLVVDEPKARPDRVQQRPGRQLPFALAGIAAP